MNDRWTDVVCKSVLCCLIFFAASGAKAQNLVPNPSFEDHDTCLQVLGFYTPNEGPSQWFSASGSPDYYQGCVPNGSGNGVPQAYHVYQYPQDGDSHVGLVTYQHVDLREYIMVELETPMVPGLTYYVSFYANAGWNGSINNPQAYIASSGIGARFTMQPRQWSIGDPWPVASNFAHVYHPGVLSDTIAWTLVSGSIVADSAYQYLMLGNHFDNANTDTLHFATYPWQPKAYVLVDNVCVSQNPTGCPLVNGVAEPDVSAVVLFPNPATDELLVRGLEPGTHAIILDALGRQVWHGNNLGGEERLDMRSWARGSYVLRTLEAWRQRSFKFVLME